MRPLIVFDGDDTLWQSEVLYDRARRAAASAAAASGLDPAEFEEAQRRIDLANVRTDGLSPERFPRSSLQAYEELCSRAGLRPDPSVAERVAAAARTVFTAVAQVDAAAPGVLAELRHGADLVLLTKGDEAVQRKRVADSGLGGCFAEVRIVAVKSEATFRRLAGDHGREPGACWSVGNSLASDINPAVAAGWNAVWIDAHVWEHERREAEPASAEVVVLARLGDLPAVFRDGDAAFERAG